MKDEQNSKESEAQKFLESIEQLKKMYLEKFRASKLKPPKTDKVVVRP